MQHGPEAASMASGQINLSRVLIPRLVPLASCLLLLCCAFPGSVPRTVKIGLSAPFEGLYRNLGYEALYAVRLAVRQRNASGGIGGRYLLEMVALNDWGEAKEAAAQAAEMEADPDILGVVGGFSPLVARVEAPEYARRGIAFAMPAVDLSRIGGEAAQVASEVLHAHRVLILQGTSEADSALAASFSGAFQAVGGSIVAQGTPSPQTGVAALLAGAGPAADLVFVAADTPTSAEWIVSARTAGFTGAIVGGPDVGSRLILDIAGAASDGVVFVSPYAPATSAPEFESAYQALSGGVPPGPVACWAYQAANRLMDAMNSAAHAGKPPRSAVVAALAAQPPLDPSVYAYSIQGDDVFTPLRR